MKKLNTIDWVMLVVLVVGGLNWGLVGIFNFDLVAAVFGGGAALSRIIYSVVGIAAAYSIVVLPMRSPERSAVMASA
ncbi:MAG: DUF378 domain-containing protein [Patescibacteria group bacterium]|nr:DUF378 domain-containing protein [Patescibacteria group bacterium]MDD5715751.1 DUF378 domain-containing protein [Patescibacteria group bacterium]